MAFVFNFDGELLVAAQNLAQPDRFALDGDIAREARLAVAHAETNQDSEGVGVGQYEDPHSGIGIVNEEGIRVETDAVRGYFESNGPADPSPVARKPGEDGRVGQHGGRPGGIGCYLIGKLAIDRFQSVPYLV